MTVGELIRVFEPLADSWMVVEEKLNER